MSFEEKTGCGCNLNAR